MISKAVIPVAGLGTRLLSVTKEQPKEMLPIFARGLDESLCLKPLVQVVFEQLYDVGFREFCFVVGRDKRAVEDHFTPDQDYVLGLNHSDKGSQAQNLEAFYRRVEHSTILWVNQPKPLGFGDAVAKAASFVGDERFLVHAGDTWILSQGTRHITSLLKNSENADAEATLLLQEVKEPRGYGLVETEPMADGVMKVTRAEEKPEIPLSDLAIMPIYVLDPAVLWALKIVRPGKGGEIQLTDGIQKMIDWQRKVYALKLDGADVWLDIGTPETYWQALQLSHKHFSSERPPSTSSHHVRETTDQNW